MNDQIKPRLTINDHLAAARRSLADIEAGRIETVDVVIAELRLHLDELLNARSLRNSTTNV